MEASSSMNDSIQTSHNNTKNTLSSDMIVTSYIQKGLQDVVVYTSIGVVVGGLMGIVLATRGSSSSSSAARKVYTSLGGGIGFGTAWTNTSIQFEQLLSSSSSSSAALPNTTTNATTSNQK